MYERKASFYFQAGQKVLDKKFTRGGSGALILPQKCDICLLKGRGGRGDRKRLPQIPSMTGG